MKIFYFVQSDTSNLQKAFESNIMIMRKYQNNGAEERRMEIRPAKREEWESSMSLAWRTFLHFEASDYTQQGVDSFLDFISDTTLHRMFLLGNYQLFVALEEERIVGIISLREINHISLLFVDEKYHRRGIGRALLEYAAMFLQEEKGKNNCTVNAAPYAVEFYHKIGFENLRPEETRDGIRYTPMIWNFEPRL